MSVFAPAGMRSATGKLSGMSVFRNRKKSSIANANKFSVITEGEHHKEQLKRLASKNAERLKTVVESNTHRSGQNSGRTGSSKGAETESMLDGEDDLEAELDALGKHDSVALQPKKEKDNLPRKSRILFNVDTSP